MTKTELLSTYTAEQLADIVENLQKENLVELLKLKNREDTEDVSKVLDAMKLTITELCNTIEDLQNENKQEKQKHAKTLWEFCDSVKKEDYDNEVNRLQSETEKYRKAFKDAKKERDCQIAEYQKKIEELEKELEYKDGTKMFETLMENTRGEAKECLARHMYENLRCVFRYEKTADEVNITNFLPTEPIKVADFTSEDFFVFTP